MPGLVSPEISPGVCERSYPLYVARAAKPFRGNGKESGPPGPHVHAQPEPRRDQCRARSYKSVSTNSTSKWLPVAGVCYRVRNSTTNSPPPRERMRRRPPTPSSLRVQRPAAPSALGLCAIGRKLDHTGDTGREATPVLSGASSTTQRCYRARSSTTPQR